MTFSLVHEIQYQEPWHIFKRFSDQPNALLFDSAMPMAGCGQYSYICFDPFKIIQSKNGVVTINNNIIAADPFAVIKDELANYKQSNNPSLPPFQGGAAGFFGYELYHYLEQIRSIQNNDMYFPDLAVGLYDTVIAFDNFTKHAWIISSGFPALDLNERKQRAEERLSQMLQKINHLSTITYQPYAICQKKNIVSNFTRNEYLAAVQKTIDYILAGDIFEANISQRFKTPLSPQIAPYDIYLNLRQLNPAPFSAFLNFEDTVIASASPERFLKLQNNTVEARPIKGTRRRVKDPVKDKQLAMELIKSEKDHAENIMIVDLMRNDLSRVCEDHSVIVTQLCGLESYATVHHLVSVIQGKLRPDVDAIDLLIASFPGGSITGAPKIRAMEIIAEIEPNPRGPYCGSIGFIGFDGSMDTSITIRTFCIKDNFITFQTGGAITMDSNPEEEYEETLTKAYALIKALTLE